MSGPRIHKADLVRLFHDGALSGLTEWQLLQRFVANREEPAFEALVARHGPMVMGVCRRMLTNLSDVEDAFQATFLVLIRRASSLRATDALGPWLHGVAVKVAQQARGSSTRRNRRERLGLLVDVAGPEPMRVDPDLRAILDEEINRLPERYRLPIVVCYLEGRTHEQAARLLEWPLGTVKGRLARARTLLEARLTRRGVAGAAAATALGAMSTARAALPPSILESTCRSLYQLGPKLILNPAVSTSVTHLVQGVLSTMVMQKLKVIVAAATASGLFLTSVGVMARQQAQPGPSDPQSAVASAGGPLEASRVRHPADGKVDPNIKSGPSVATDVQKVDPKRINLRALNEARQAMLLADEELESGKGSLDRVYLASRMLMQRETNAATGPVDKLKAIQDHLARMKRQAHRRAESGSPNGADAASARAYAAEAEFLVAEAAAPQPASGQTGNSSSVRGGPSNSRTEAILTKLEDPIAMSFHNETPLEEVLKFIQMASQGPSDTGIPIYVDPRGLEDADKTMTSPIHLDLEGIPLRRTLQLALAQLGLRYYVDDGILVITSQNSEEDRLPPSTIEPSPYRLKQERAERGEMTLDEMKSFVEELKIRKEMLNALNNLNSIDEGGVRGAPTSTAGLESLVKEIHELVGQLKEGRGGAEKRP